METAHQYTAFLEALDTLKKDAEQNGVFDEDTGTRFGDDVQRAMATAITNFGDADVEADSQFRKMEKIARPILGGGGRCVVLLPMAKLRLSTLAEESKEPRPRAMSVFGPDDATSRLN